MDIQKIMRNTSKPLIKKNKKKTRKLKECRENKFKEKCQKMCFNPLFFVEIVTISIPGEYLRSTVPPIVYPFVISLVNTR